MQLRARHDLVAARDFHELQSRSRFVIGLQCLDRRRHVFLRLVGKELEQHLRRERLGRREDQCLDNGFERVVYHGFCGSPIGCGASVGRARL